MLEQLPTLDLAHVLEFQKCLLHEVVDKVRATEIRSLNTCFFKGPCLSETFCQQVHIFDDIISLFLSPWNRLRQQLILKPWQLDKAILDWQLAGGITLF